MATRISGQNDSLWQSLVDVSQDPFRQVLVAFQRVGTVPDERVAAPLHSPAQNRGRNHGLRHPRGGGFTLRTPEGLLARDSTPTGHIIRRAGMSVDSDGAPKVTKKQDKNHRRDTSMTWGGHYVDASTIPYIVMPLNRMPAGVHLGDLARVSYNGHLAYAIVADRGGSDTRHHLHGEGSMRLAAMLGMDPSPSSGGVSSGVTYEIIPGSGRRFGITSGGPAFTEDQIQAFGINAFEALAFEALG